MDTIFKTYKAEIRSVDENTGEIDMLIPVSTSSVDRDGEVVEPTAFKKTLPKFMKRPVLVAAHDYRDLTNQIGEWSKLKITDDGIEGKPKYYVNAGNEQADWGFYLASKGMAAFSIGFIPKVWEDGDGAKEPRRTYKEVELLEISQVIVPSNREAIQSIRSKSVDPVVNEICDAVEKEIITKPEETDEYIRIPVDRGDHEGHRIRTIPISDKEGIKAIYCGECKKVLTYLFAKDKGWTMEKARAWVKDHEKSVIISITTNNVTDDELVTATIQTDDIILNSPHAAQTSQEQIIDELDYIIRLIDTEGMNDDVKKDAWNLVRGIMRLAGDDIPDDIRETLVPKQIKKETLSEEQVRAIIANEVTKAIRKALGAID